MEAEKAKTRSYTIKTETTEADKNGDWVVTGAVEFTVVGGVPQAFSFERAVNEMDALAQAHRQLEFVAAGWSQYSHDIGGQLRDLKTG